MKPLRPFPLPIRVGTDICQISRIFGIITTARGPSFVRRVLTAGEQSANKERLAVVVEEGKMPKLGLGEKPVEKEPKMWALAAFLAGRFAAKEAAMKAHPHRHLTFHDLTIERMGASEEPGEEGVKQRLGSGPPIVRIAASEGEEADGSALLSISHDGDYATAVCIGAEEPQKGRGL